MDDEEKADSAKNNIFFFFFLSLSSYRIRNTNELTIFNFFDDLIIKRTKICFFETEREGKIMKEVFIYCLAFDIKIEKRELIIIIILKTINFTLTITQHNIKLT